MRCLPSSNGNLTTGPVSHSVTGHRWNIVNNYLTLTFEVCCISNYYSPIKNMKRLCLILCLIAIPATMSNVEAQSRYPGQYSQTSRTRSNNQNNRSSGTVTDGVQAKRGVSIQHGLGGATITFDLSGKNKKDKTEAKSSKSSQAAEKVNETKMRSDASVSAADRFMYEDYFGSSYPASQNSSTAKNTNSSLEGSDNSLSSINDSSKAKDDIALVVDGEGTDKNEATKNALRSAIEQAYGVFVSANTEILNDELVKDEIATVASGNIKSYKELSSVTLPNGNTSVSLSAIVSIGKLVTYAQSKGASAEFAGQSFMMEIKMYELNKENETKALEHLLAFSEQLSESFFDFTLEIGEAYKKRAKIFPWLLIYTTRPVVHLALQNTKKISITPGYCIPLTVVVKRNENYRIWEEMITQKLQALSLSHEEIAMLNMRGIDYRAFKYAGNTYYLRSESPVLEAIRSAIGERANSSITSWEIIEVGTGNKYAPVFDSTIYIGGGTTVRKWWNFDPDMTVILLEKDSGIISMSKDEQFMRGIDSTIPQAAQQNQEFALPPVLNSDNYCIRKENKKEVFISNFFTAKKERYNFKEDDGNYVGVFPFELFYEGSSISRVEGFKINKVTL